MLHLCATPYRKLYKDIEDVRSRVSALGDRDKTLDYPAHISLAGGLDLPNTFELDLQTLLTKHFRVCPAPRILNLDHHELSKIVYLAIDSTQLEPITHNFFCELNIEGLCHEHVGQRSLCLCVNNPNSAQIFEDAKRLIDLEYPDRTGWNVCLYKDVVNQKNGRSEWELICGA